MIFLVGCMSREAREEARLDRMSAYISAREFERSERDSRFLAGVRERQAAAGTFRGRCAGPYCDVDRGLNGANMTEARERRMRLDRARKRSTGEGRRAIDEAEWYLAREGE